MAARYREWESSSKVALIALAAVACVSMVPPIVGAVVQASASARVDIVPLHFTCRSCGVIEDVREVTLRAARYSVSTVSGDGVAMLLGMLTGRLGTRAANILEVAVRLQDGSLRVFHEAASSAWKPGDRVKITMGKIRPAS